MRHFAVALLALCAFAGVSHAETKEKCPVDLYFVLDNSSSMAKDGEPYYFKTESLPFAKDLLDSLADTSDVRVSFVVFDKQIKRRIEPVSGEAEIDAAFASMERLGAGAGTNIGIGIEQAVEFAKADADAGTASGNLVMVVLTDGRNDPETLDNMITQAALARNYGFDIYAVGVKGREEEGKELNEQELALIASEPRETHLYIASPEALDEVTNSIEADIENSEACQIAVKCPIDLYFVMDNSASMSQNGEPVFFRDESIPFAEDLLQGLEDSSLVRASFIVFDKQIKRSIAPIGNDALIDEAIDSLKRLGAGAGTNIGIGIQKAVEVAEEDARSGSASSNKIMVVLTDGRNDPETAADVPVQAERARKFGFEIFAIGVKGREIAGQELDANELQLIASQPYEDHVFIDTPEALPIISDKIEALIEDDASCRPKKKCPVDLYFVMDNSASMSEDGKPVYFKDESIPFAQDLITGLEDTSILRVSFVVFDKQIKRKVPPTSDPAEIDAAIESLYRQGKGAGTNIGIGIETAYDLAVADYGRERNLVMVVLTDGRNDPETLSNVKVQADIAKDYGFEIYAIGVKGREEEGRELDPAELAQIASDPVDQYMFIEEPGKLAIIADAIERRIENSQACAVKRCPVDLYFVMDISASMSEGGEPVYFRQESIPFAEDLLQGLEDTSLVRASFVVFDKQIKRKVAPTSNEDEIDAAIESLKRLSAGAGTNIGIGIETAVDLALEDRASGTMSSNLVMVVLTDGRNDPETADNVSIQAQRARGLGFDVYAVGVTGREEDGERLNESELQIIASKPYNTHVFIDLPEALDKISDEIEKNIEDTLSCVDRLCPLDLYFVMDNSASMSQNGEPVFFENESIPFAMALLDGLEDDTDVRVAFVVFDKQIKRKIAPVSSEADIEAAFESLSRLGAGAGTNIGIGIRQAVELAAQDKAANEVAQSTNLVMVVLTDGRNDPETLADVPIQANRAKEFGFEIFAVGVKGREEDGMELNEAELQLIASEPFETHLFIASPEALNEVGKNIENTIENSPECLREMCPIDLYFVMDNSASQSENGVPVYFRDESIPFAADLYSGLSDTSNVRVGIAVFDKQIKRKIAPVSGRVEVQAALDSLYKLSAGAGTNIGIGIQQAVDLAKEDKFLGTASNKLVMVVLTDGRNDPETLANVKVQADAAKAYGFEVFAVGVAGREEEGKELDPAELAVIASEPTEEHSFIDTPDALLDISDRIEAEIEDRQSCKLQDTQFVRVSTANGRHCLANHGFFVRVKDCILEPNDHLDFEITPEGFFKRPSDGKCMEVYGAPRNWASLRTVGCTGADNQKFRMLPNGELQSVRSGRCVIQAAMGLAKMYDCSKPDKPFWEFSNAYNGITVPIDEAPMKLQRIMDAEGQCWDTKGYYVRAKQCDEDSESQMVLISETGMIYRNSDGRCLDVMAPGRDWAPIRTIGCTGDDNQLFKFQNPNEMTGTITVDADPGRCAMVASQDAVKFMPCDMPEMAHEWMAFEEEEDETTTEITPTPGPAPPPPPPPPPAPGN